MSSEIAVILVGGGHSCGKLRACRAIEQQLLRSPIKQFIEVRRININEEYLSTEQEHDNSPLKYDLQRLKKDLKHISLQESVVKQKKLPIYLVHGLYALYDSELNSMATMKIFVDCDADTRLINHINKQSFDQEDLEHLEPLLANYVNFARHEFTEFILPTKQFADIILPQTDHEINYYKPGDKPPNTGIAIGLICDAIVPMLIRQFEIFFKNGISVGGIESNLQDLDINGIPKLNIRGEEFSEQVGRFYDLS